MMTKNYLLALMVLVACTLQAQIVNIPDANFKTALIAAGVDTDGNKEISAAEAEIVKELDISNKGIGDLQGIEAFKNLEKLNCSRNDLTTLDISKNIKLTVLHCSSNDLIYLDTSKNIKLTSLSCNNNQLTTLDVSKNIELTYLDCTALEAYSNRIKTLDVTENTKLEFLMVRLISDTQLDLRNNPNLKELYCDSETLRFLYLKSGTNFFKDWPNCEEPSNGTFNLNTPNIEYICADESELECLQKKLDEKGYTNCNTN